MNNYPALPGPPMLLDHLSGLVFIGHIIFMNYVVAAPFIIAWYLWTRPTDGISFAKWMSAALPVAFTFTITFGVGPLLFVQALFPERFYTANILIAEAWLLVIIFLMAAFYGGYVVKTFAKQERRHLSAMCSVLTGILVWTTAAVMVSNYFASTSKDLWSIIEQNAWQLLHSPTFVPRYLHYIVGAFALTGFWMVWISRWRERREGESFLLRSFRKQGLLLAASATGLQTIVGVWFLVWLPSETWDRLFSGSFPSLVWIFGVATGLFLLGSLIVASVFPERSRWQWISTVLLGLTLVGMISGRDLVRITAFGADFSLRKIAYATRHEAMMIFFGILILGTAIVVMLITWIGNRRPLESK